MAEIKTPKSFSHLTAISSLDGRFRGRVEPLSNYFSEFATIKGRVFVEIEYLISFLKQVKIPLSKRSENILRKIHQNFTLSDAEIVWKKDEEINHDTKAVEYLLQKKLTASGLSKYINFLHFGLTSTDIDNTALGLSLKAFSAQVFIPRIEILINTLSKIAKEHKDLVMPARTHSQVAVPTIAGKELANFQHRLEVQLNKFKALKMGSKVSGAVGNYNALVVAYPNVNWSTFVKKFLGRLGLENYLYTTQVEPYDHKVEYIQAVKRINYVIVSLAEDIWRYLALGYLSLRDAKGHVGSSTMPQKINPIGFEMTESYCLLANGILDVLEKKLPVNRLQRDLTDKYILRDLGQALSMSVLAFESANSALGQIGFNKAFIEKELDNHWELIAEGIQTILRTTDYTEPYEKLKELTRGKVVTKESYEKFIEEIEVSEEIKKKLRELTPRSYIGVAKKLVTSF